MNATQQPLLKSDPLINQLEAQAMDRIAELRIQAIHLLSLPRSPTRETRLSKVRREIQKAERKVAGIKQLTLGVVADDSRESSGVASRTTLGPRESRRRGRAPLAG